MKSFTKALLILSAVAMAACVPMPAVSGVESSPAGEETSIDSTNQWSQEAADMMMRVNGELAPFIKLSDGYTCRLMDEDTDPTVYIHSNDRDLSEEYMEIVEDAGYTQYVIDNSAGYNRYVYTRVAGDIEIYLQFDWYPGGNNPRGFEIFTWNDLYVPDEINYDLIEDWADEEKEAFLDKFGEIIPLAPLSEDYVFTWIEEDWNFIITDPMGRYDAFAQYVGEIVDMPEWVLSLSFYNQGYIVFEKAADNVENGVLHLNMRHSNRGGFVVDVWMTIEMPPVLITEWSESDKVAFNAIFQDEDAVPLAPISDEYIFDMVNLAPGFDLIDIFDPHPIENFSDTYIPILEEAGFVENDYYYPRFGYHVFDKPSEVISDFYVEINFMVLPNGVSIQIYLQEILGGTAFTDEFPVDQIKRFMVRNNIEYKEFPFFPSDVDGRYLYVAGDSDFAVEIYQDEDLEVLLEETYKDVLAEDGWVIDDSLYDKGWGYFARKEGYDFYFRFFSLEGVFVFHIYPNSYDPTQGMHFGG